MDLHLNSDSDNAIIDFFDNAEPANLSYEESSDVSEYVPPSSIIGVQGDTTDDVSSPTKESIIELPPSSNRGVQVTTSHVVAQLTTFPPEESSNNVNNVLLMI